MAPRSATTAQSWSDEMEEQGAEMALTRQMAAMQMPHLTEDEAAVESASERCSVSDGTGNYPDVTMVARATESNLDFDVSDVPPIRMDEEIAREAQKKLEATRLLFQQQLEQHQRRLAALQRDAEIAAAARREAEELARKERERQAAIDAAAADGLRQLEAERDRVFAQLREQERQLLAQAAGDREATRRARSVVGASPGTPFSYARAAELPPRQEAVPRQEREQEEDRQGREVRPREAAQPVIITGKLTLTPFKGGDLKGFLEAYFLEATQRGHRGRALQLQLEQLLPEKLRKAVSTHARTAEELDPEDGAFQQNVTESLLTSFGGTSTGNPADMYLRTLSTRRWQMRQERIDEFALDMAHTYRQYGMAKGWDVAERRRNEPVMLIPQIVKNLPAKVRSVLQSHVEYSYAEARELLIQRVEQLRVENDPAVRDALVAGTNDDPADRSRTGDKRERAEKADRADELCPFELEERGCCRKNCVYMHRAEGGAGAGLRKYKAAKRAVAAQDARGRGGRGRGGRGRGGFWVPWWAAQDWVPPAQSGAAGNSTAPAPPAAVAHPPAGGGPFRGRGRGGGRGRGAPA